MRIRPGRTLSVAVAALALAGCPPREVAPAGTAAPPFAGSPVGEVPRGEFLGYARSLAYDTARAAGDQQPLPLWDEAGAVVRHVTVRVEPERGAAFLSRAELGAGRIIARYQARSAYPPLGIPAGRSYVWVDSLGGSFREVVVPDGEGPVVEMPLEIEAHPPEYFGPRPVFAARWIEMAGADDGETDTVGCNRPGVYVCCKCRTYARPAPRADGGPVRR
jgi:hypothetical protein